MKALRILGIVLAFAIATVAVFWWYYTQPAQTSQQSKQVSAKITGSKDERLSKGVSGSPVEMTEYIDMFCPSCARAHLEVLPKIESEYIDTAKLHYETRIVAKIDHRDAQSAANGAYCAAEQNKFWDFIDRTYEKTAKLYQKNSDPKEINLFSGTNARNLAREAGVNVPKWENCVKQRSYSEVIAKNEKDMSALNAYGTPHSVINGEGYNGAPPYRTFKTVIDAALKEVDKKQKKEKQ